MKNKDVLLLEQAYQQIILDKQLHQQFLIEVNLLDKTKQVGGAILNKVKGMLGNSVASLLGIIQKADPQLFSKIQNAVNKNDEQTLQSIFKDPEVKQQQQEIAKESLMVESVVDTIKNLYAKASNFLTENPSLAVKIALAGILAAAAAAGPEGLSHLAGFLLQTGGKALGGAAVGGTLGGIVGGIQGGLEGAKKKAKDWAKKGAIVGVGMGAQDAMAHGFSSVEDVFANARNAVEALKEYGANIQKINSIGSDLDYTISKLKDVDWSDPAKSVNIKEMLKSYKISAKSALGDVNMSEETFEKIVNAMNKDPMTKHAWDNLLIKNGGPKG